MKYIQVFVCILLLIGISVYLYTTALTQSTYEGLPTVPCLDYTKPIVQNFSIMIFITVHGSPYSLNPQIGHDAGNCLHDIFTNDASGKVYVRANDSEQFSLGQFFDVWHKTFTPQQIFSFPVNAQHPMEVTVNNKSIEDYRNVILTPQQIIHISYK